MTLALTAMGNHNRMCVAVVISLEYLSISVRNVAGNLQAITQSHDGASVGAADAEPR